MRLTPLVLCLALAGACSAQAPDMDSAPEAALELRGMQGPQLRDALQRAAKRELRTFIAQLRRDIKAGTLPDQFPLDIDDLSDLRSASLGDGYQVHTLDPDALMEGAKRVEDMVVPLDIWNFFIMVEDRVIGQMSMEKINGKWMLGNIGSYGTAQSVREAMTQNRSSRDFRFVRIYQAKADLMEVDLGEGKQYLPLVSARYSLGLPKDTRSMDSQGVLSVLQNAVRENLAAHEPRNR